LFPAARGAIVTPSLVSFRGVDEIDEPASQEHRPVFLDAGPALRPVPE
jgi:hypothetical protein